MKNKRIKVVTQVIRKKQLLAEGYQAMAERHKEFASLSEKASREVLPDWDTKRCKKEI